jgi:folate-dependent phosphoribosylglycinamide formyltransferase PurN
VASFVIVTTADLAEAYFLAAFLESRAQPFAIVNLVARPVSNQLRVLARLRRNRGTVYVADLILGRLTHRLLALSRPKAPLGGAYPQVTEAFVQRVRFSYPRLDCNDPHAPDVLAFVRGKAPDYILLAGAPVLQPSFYGLARQATLNRHLGLVPEFRGSDCATWAFALNRADMAGYSIHTVTGRVDGGDVIVRQPVPVRDEPTLDAYLRRLRREASDAFVGVIDQLLQGVPLPVVPQAHRGMYFPPAGWSARRRAQRNYARLLGGARRPVRRAVRTDTDKETVQGAGAGQTA